MKSINFAEQKISLAQTILSLKDASFVKRIEAYLDELIKAEKSTQTIQVEDGFDARKLAFDEWNQQFDDDYNLDDFIPEHGMTLRDFRLKIYNSEKGDGMSKKRI